MMADHPAQSHDGTVSINDQLATPALTPISEHGDRLGYDVPNLNGFRNANLKQRKAHKGSLSKKENEHSTQQNGVLINGNSDKLDGKTSPRTNKLSPIQLHELVSSPESLPIRALDEFDPKTATHDHECGSGLFGLGLSGSAVFDSGNESEADVPRPVPTSISNMPSISATPGALANERPSKAVRSASTPQFQRKHSSHSHAKTKPHPAPLKLDIQNPTAANGNSKTSALDGREPSPTPAVIPLPPLSLPTYLQLELSSHRPSALYIHRSTASDFPYESAKAKFERLQNFFLLPPSLEQVLWFGAVSCLDAWLYTFTILPLRFLKAVTILVQWWTKTVIKEILELGRFVYQGLGRLWRRQRRHSKVPCAPTPDLQTPATSRRPSVAQLSTELDSALNSTAPASAGATDRKSRKLSSGFRHRRARSTPSALLPNHKADILQGLLIICSCFVLMRLDASRLYHNIRGQAAIKLYVIYNVLEVFDRLFSAIGQDVLECLFSKETLERDEAGRSKILRPLWMFLLALVYNVIHATALFYQVVTLNVAVNSYSNALLTLLMSNQFVEIKGTVFKKFEKESLFQLTCADVVERFQLWLMLLIIALRNIVEVGGLSVTLNNSSTNTSTMGQNTTPGILPLTYGSLVPKAFTLFPKWTGEVLGPFLIVLGSEALVDWCKHAYITKFNQLKPNIYGRFLDLLAKDYYSHAFADQNLTKRLGLPVIPLSCLFIRACVQTYHMFINTYMPPPVASAATSVILENDAASSSPATTAALQHIDQVIRRALGRSSFESGAEWTSTFNWWRLDDAIAFATMAFFFVALYLVLLAFKLILGMALLSYARRRYKGMKERERQSAETSGRRVGGWGTVEVSEDKRRWIYEDDAKGLHDLREKEELSRRRAGAGEKGEKLELVQRYTMSGKRIW